MGSEESKPKRKARAAKTEYQPAEESVSPEDVAQALFPG